MKQFSTLVVVDTDKNVCYGHKFCYGDNFIHCKNKNETKFNQLNVYLRSV